MAATAPWPVRRAPARTSVTRKPRRAAPRSSAPTTTPACAARFPTAAAASSTAGTRVQPDTSATRRRWPAALPPRAVRSAARSRTGAAARSTAVAPPGRPATRGQRSVARRSPTRRRAARLAGAVWLPTAAGTPNNATVRAGKFATLRRASAASPSRAPPTTQACAACSTTIAGGPCHASLPTRAIRRNTQASATPVRSHRRRSRTGAMAHLPAAAVAPTLAAAAACPMFAVAHG
jgi:hypothetical protein